MAQCEPWAQKRPAARRHISRRGGEAPPDPGSPQDHAFDIL